MKQQKHQHRIFVDFIIILFFVFLGFGAGWLHLSSQPLQWKVSAQFEAPRIAELGNYYTLSKTYQQVQNDGKIDASNEQAIIMESYGEFKRAITALDARLDFLSGNTTVNQIAQVYNQPMTVFARQLAERLSFDPATSTLSLSLANPELASQILNEFIRVRSIKARENLNDELIKKWQLLFQQVKQSADANIGEGWQEKLNLMRSVQPLDNQLTPYRLVQKPIVASKPELPENFYEVLAICGGIGFFLGLFVVFLRRN